MILFLDFDGVIHPQFPSADYPEAENEFFCFVPRLESVLRDFPDVWIVISSSWREIHTLAELRAHFSPDVAGQIIGKTPTLGIKRPLDPFPARGIRSREVREWLARNHQTDTPWVALDDDEWNYFPDDPVILCDDGFRDVEEAALRTALMKSLLQRNC